MGRISRMASATNLMNGSKFSFCSGNIEEENVIFSVKKRSFGNNNDTCVRLEINGDKALYKSNDTLLFIIIIVNSTTTKKSSKNKAMYLIFRGRRQTQGNVDHLVRNNWLCTTGSIDVVMTITLMQRVKLREVLTFIHSLTDK